MLINTERDQIQQAHPILKLPFVQLLIFEQVIKINRHKQEQSRFLLITSAGLFLLGKRKFPSGYRSSRVISYSEITKISLTTSTNTNGNQQEEISLFSNDQKILQIITKNATEIVARIYVVRYTLFGNVELELAKEMQNAVDTSSFIFESNSILADRFVSLCANDTSLQLNEQITFLYQILLQTEKNVKYTPEILSSPFVMQYTQTIAKSTSEFSIVLNRGNFASFMRYFSIIFAENSYLEGVSFQYVSINGLDSINLFQQANNNFNFNNKNNESNTNNENNTNNNNINNDNSSSNNNIKNNNNGKGDKSSNFKSISFKKCDLTHSCFKLFLNDLMRYKGTIQSLKLEEPNIDQHGLTAFFNTLFDSPCLHYLSDLVLSGISIKDRFQLLLIQLMGSNFVLSNKPLRKVAIHNSEIVVDYVLPVILLFETGCNKLRFTNCQFLNPIDATKVRSFQQIRELDLSMTTFTADSLISLFIALMAASSSPSVLTLNQIRIENKDLTLFYKGISGTCVLPSLETFTWTNNPINDADVEPFFTFLKEQPILSDINISYSLNIKDNSKFNFIASAIGSLPLERFVMRGRGPSSYGAPFNEILRILADSENMAELKGIDIVGQKIGDIGLGFLKICIEKSLIAVAFDQTGASLNALINLVDKIMLANVESVEWPEDDFKSGLSKIALTSRPEYTRRIDGIKKQFVSKFGADSTNGTSNRLFSNNDGNGGSKSFASLGHLRTGTTRYGAPQGGDNRASSLKRSQTSRGVDYEGIMAMKDDELEGMLAECIGTESLQPKNDPLVVAYRNINEATALPKLC